VENTWKTKGLLLFSYTEVLVPFVIEELRATMFLLLCFSGAEKLGFVILWDSRTPPVMFVDT